MKVDSNGLEFSHLFDLMFQKVYLDSSGVEGIGVFAGEPIKRGAAVLPIFGLLHRISKAKTKCPKWGFQISDDIELDPANEVTFMNHSCSPNVHVNDDWLLVASKDIAEGEELTLDYGTTDYFDYGFECRCNSNNCRRNFHGMISSDRAFQKEKSRFFSPYLKEKFGLV